MSVSHRITAVQTLYRLLDIRETDAAQIVDKLLEAAVEAVQGQEQISTTQLNVLCRQNDMLREILGISSSADIVAHLRALKAEHQALQHEMSSIYDLLNQSKARSAS